MNGHSEGFYVIASIGSSCEIRQVELNLVPSFIQPHGHGTNEWLHSGCRLIVWCSESSSHVFVIQYLHFESEIFFELSFNKICTFFMIMTKKGNLIPRVYFSLAGQVMYAVVTFVPIISKTDDWMSWSVNLLMWPLWTKGNSKKYLICPKFAMACYLYCTILIGNRIGMCSETSVWFWNLLILIINLHYFCFYQLS